MPKARIAQISGTFLVPGVSKNRRLYRKDTIANAVKTMQTRLADPNGRPLQMMAHHPQFAGGDTRAVCAKLTEARFDAATGAGLFTADVADNEAGANLVALTTEGDDGKRYLNNCSIRGWWTGPVETRVVDGIQVETADDLEVDGIDFTGTPGLDEARISKVILESVQAQAGARRPIVETAGTVEVVSSESAALAGLATVLSEAYASLNIDNGPAEIRIAGWTSEPSELLPLVERLAAATAAALNALDPDADGDIDGIDSNDGDELVAALFPESAPAANQKEAQVAETQTSQTKATEATDATSKATTEAAPSGLDAATKAAIAEAVAEAFAATKPAETDSATSEAATSASTVGETDEAKAEALVKQLVAEARADIRTELISQLRSEGLIPGARKGLVRVTDESFDYSALNKADKDKIAGDALVERLFPGRVSADS